MGAEISKLIDLLVIGGGINGAGIARDAAGRGLDVVLCEKDDLAQHTSSSSTKLVHGGLRYLEHYEFRLVRDALIEREVLLAMAPHIIWPMRFVLPHHSGLRPAWLIRLGLFLYDNLGGRKILPGTSKADLKNTPHADLFRDSFKFGFEYSDCWVEDSRLVVVNAMDARDRGAQILTRTECVNLERQDNEWLVTLAHEDGTRETMRARAVVNAAGPWVDNVLGLTNRKNNQNNLRLVKGSHLIVNRMFDHDMSYILQNSDDRIVFAIPYEHDFTLIGTTDAAYSLSDGDPEISIEETDYLLSLINEYVSKPVTRDDVVATYSGVRPLYDDKSEDASVVTRDYVFDLNVDGERAPILSIFGGKITTFRKLSEQAIDRLSPFLEPSKPQAWTKGASLPGGDIPDADFDGFVAQIYAQYADLPRPLLMRLARAYGTRISTVIGDATDISGLGQAFGDDFFEREATYLVDHEFAKSAEDILYRRSKLYLHLSAQASEKFKNWFAQNYG